MRNLCEISCDESTGAADHFQPPPHRKAVHGGQDGRPLISVVMAVFNGMPYLHDSIQSILAQDRADFEFIIVDDGSNDGTPMVLRKCAQQDPRIHILRNDVNLGMSASLNAGIQVATGRYIARHDADDIALPHRFSLQTEFMETHKEVFLVGGSAFLMDRNGALTGVRQVPTDPNTIEKLLPIRNPMIHPSIMFRNEGRKIYREKFMVGSDDYDFFLRLLHEGKAIHNLPFILLKYRVVAQPAASTKHARYALFCCKAKEFHRQRCRSGGDGYNDFDPQPIMSLDPQKTNDPVVLETFIRNAIQQNDFDSARSWIRRYCQDHSLLNQWPLWHLGTFLPKKSLGALRKVKRHGTRRFVFEMKEWPKATELPHLGVFLGHGGGLSTYARIGSLKREMALYRKLAEDGCQITLHTYDRTSRLPQLDFPVAINPQWPWLLPKGFNILYRAAFPLFQYGCRQKVSVMMTNQAHDGWPAIAAAKLKGIKSIARSGWVFGEAAQNEGWTGQRVKAAIRAEKWANSKADLCILPTKELADWISINYHIDPEKIRVIPNYVNTEVFAPAAPNGSRIDVLCIGRLSREKRYDLVLEALRGAGIRLVIIGSGPEKERLKALATQLGVDLAMIDRIENEALPDYLNRAKVFLIASAREGHPKSLAEAMACGCACVGTDVPGIRNQITDGVSGVLVSSKPADLRSAVLALLGDSELRAHLSRGARQYACANFSFDKIGRLYLQTITDLFQRL
jgi:glycosyltransferase involved in cell wall biosynthesis